MTTYIALLRGINVSGQKLIKMALLREALEKLEYLNIRTYIQSGNIVFDSPEKALDTLASEIKGLILTDFGFDVPVLVIKSERLKRIVTENPFANEDLKRVYVALLYTAPAPERLELINAIDISPEAFAIEGEDMYLFSPLGAAKSKLTNNFIEQKLKVSATTRNWNTINKLISMADESAV